MDMVNIQGKIIKLIKALEFKGYIYLFNKEQIYSNSKEKICSINKLFHLIPIEEYNKMHPDKEKDPSKYKYIKEEVLTTFRQQDILLKLVDIYKEVCAIDG
ncbi:TPA: hypothetical protein PTW06_003636 [Clostridium botulinum]|nr:hypothetical protein [Clostridium botulinum]HDK7226204.1 hypothetical protein [Clostridium botulinum]HDK7273697.1 hypothetical protein [Clostridium botulinum]HDK7307045.1 hypothetical protein [Clostridium botulinum]